MALSKTTNNMTLDLIPTKLAVQANRAEKAVIGMKKETHGETDCTEPRFVNKGREKVC